MRIHSPQITGSAANTNIILTTVTASISVLSSSFAATASYWSGSIINAASASYWSGSIINAATASYVLQAQSASYWSGSIQNATSASYALTASYAANVPETASYALQANSASFALTASYISGSGGGVGFPFSGSAIITGSLFVSGSTISGSFKGDGSQITGLTAGGKIHTQTSAASTWTFTHNLGVQYPNVTVYDNNNNVIIPQTITATDANTLTLTFGSAVAGYAVAGIGGIINVQGRTTQQYFTASTTWSFAHNLGDKYVSLQAFDDAFEMMIPTTIRLVDFTSSLLLFDSASSGYAVATIGGDLPAISSSYAGYTLQVANSAPYSASWVAAANVTVTNAVSSSFAATASSADNLTVRGTLTAQTINVQTITSSIEFITGSTRNGSLSTNTHEFTGSVSVSGSVGIGTNAPSQLLEVVGGEIKAGRVDSSNEGGQVSFGRATDNTTAWYIDSYGNVASPQLRFVDVTGAAVRMTLTGSNVGIGTSSPSQKLEVIGTTKLSSAAGNITGINITPGSVTNTYQTIGESTAPGGVVRFHAGIVTGWANWENYGASYMDFKVEIKGSGTSDTSYTAMQIRPTGDIRMSSLVGSGTRTVVADANGQLSAPVSDVTMKENIRPIGYGINEIMQMNPVWFEFKDEFKDYGTGRQNGNIAQELEIIIPEAVFLTPNKNKKGIEYGQLHAVYIKAIQELSAKNTTLEERLTALENK